MKIALFTSCHPDIGGGSVHLRNAIEHLTEHEVRWFYLGKEPSHFQNTECLGQSRLGGHVIRDLLAALKLWTLGDFPLRDELIRRVQSWGAEALWVVAMAEGISAGKTLKSKLRLPLHVTVHDDPARTQAGRSRRYRPFRALFQRSFRDLARMADSIDVISEPMQRHYATDPGVKSIVYFRHLPVLPEIAETAKDSKVCWLGHIGAVYGPEELATCLKAFGQACSRLGRKAGVRFFGESRFGPGFMERFLPAGSQVDVIATSPEGEAIARLMECDFVWAMYPFDRASRFFCETSCPTKVSTYLQVQRPIFAQTPAGSTLDTLVKRHRLGIVATQRTVESARESIELLLTGEFPASAFEAAREDLCGYHNVERLRSVFNFKLF